MARPCLTTGRSEEKKNATQIDLLTLRTINHRCARAFVRGANTSTHNDVRTRFERQASTNSVVYAKRDCGRRVSGARRPLPYRHRVPPSRYPTSDPNVPDARATRTLARSANPSAYRRVLRKTGLNIGHTNPRKTKRFTWVV